MPQVAWKWLALSFCLPFLSTAAGSARGAPISARRRCNQHHMARTLYPRGGRAMNPRKCGVGAPLYRTTRATGRPEG